MEMRDIENKDEGTPVQVKEVQVGTKPQEFRPFTDQETKALAKDGAVFLNLTGETIEDQIAAGRPIRFDEDIDLEDNRDRLLKLPSISAQVAIYPNPREFFIAISKEGLLRQETIARGAGKYLRERLGLRDDGLDVIIPDQASTFTELTFKYLDETTKKGRGIWLFGRDYGHENGITKNPVNASGSRVAVVGSDASYRGGSDKGILITSSSSWITGGGDFPSVVRLVVAKKR